MSTSHGDLSCADPSNVSFGPLAETHSPTEEIHPSHIDGDVVLQWRKQSQKKEFDRVGSTRERTMEGEVDVDTLVGQLAPSKCDVRLCKNLVCLVVLWLHLSWFCLVRFAMAVKFYGWIRTKTLVFRVFLFLRCV